MEGVRFNLPYGTYSNTFEYSLIFSIKKRKWLGRIKKGDWEVSYNLLPGTYILFETRGHRDGESILKIKLIRINKEIKEIKKLFEGEYFGFPRYENRIVFDFIRARPPYHGLITIPQSIYSKEEVNQILQRKLPPLMLPE